MKKKIALFCSILAITVMAAACGNSSTEKNTGTNAGGSETTSVSGETGTQTGTEQKDTTDAQTNTSAGDTNTAPQTSSDANDESIKDSDGESQARGSVMLPYSEAAQEQYGLPAEFILDDMPERLIVMTMGPTEILHELGVSMLAVPDIIDESQEWAQDLDAQRLPFTAKTMDTESIVALKPDMIIMSAGKKEAYGDFLESQGIPVYYTVSTSMDGGAIDSVKAEVSMYGEGFGRTEELAALMDRFDDLEASISTWKQEHADLAGQKLMILLECPFTYTNTSNTTLGGMLSELGYVNMADSIDGLESVMGTSTLQISSEVIVEQNPPLIIAQPAGVGAGISITSEEYKANLEAEYAKDPQVWESIEAVKNGKVLYLGTDDYPGTTGLGIFKCYEYLMEALPKL